MSIKIYDQPRLSVRYTIVNDATNEALHCRTEPTTDAPVCEYVQHPKSIEGPHLGTPIAMNELPGLVRKIVLGVFFSGG